MASTPKKTNIPTWINKINQSVILRNVILAVCAIVVFIFLVSVILNVFTRHGSHTAVPNFVEMDLHAAEKAARRASLRLEVSDSLYVPAYPGGVILDQDPDSGAMVKAGRRIFVVVNSFHQKQVRIPYVTGFSLRQAKNTLEVAGLGIDKIIYRPDIATNYVLEERYRAKLITPTSNDQAEAGTGVTIVVGLADGAPGVKIPKLVGFPAKEAKSRLWELGLNVGEVINDGEITPINIGDARVYSQTPEQGEVVQPGRSVTIRLTLNPDKVNAGSKTSDRSAAKIIQSQPSPDDQANQTQPEGQQPQ